MDVQIHDDLMKLSKRAIILWVLKHRYWFPAEDIVREISWENLQQRFDELTPKIECLLKQLGAAGSDLGKWFSLHKKITVLEKQRDKLLNDMDKLLGR